MSGAKKWEVSFAYLAEGTKLWILNPVADDFWLFGAMCAYIVCFLVRLPMVNLIIGTH